jgi:hypothetical protein
MAGQTPRSIVLDRLKWLVRIVASSAPQCAAAVAGTGTQSQLFDVADDFEISGRRTRWRGVVIGRVDVLQALPRYKIAEFFPGIGNTRSPKQMALLADAIASSGFEFRGIYNRALARIGQMHFNGAMTAFATNSLGRKYRRPILI